MTDQKQTADLVPGWDGNSRGWRRYTREVTWYVMGTKRSLRPFLAPRLIAKLTGPARLLAMGWNQLEFNGKDGVKKLLERLSNSPLVRRSLPNTSAVLSQYFSYKRGHSESISNYLVREALYFEEFVESLVTLKDEQDGRPRPLLPDFGDDGSDSEDGDDAGSQNSKSSKATKTKVSPKSEGYARVPSRDPDSPHPGLPHRPLADGPPGLASLSDFDSFILKQLRGWRLLQGACLNPSEWRSVTASTSNKLDYQTVCIALTILFDEQAMQRQQGVQQHGHGVSVFAMDQEDGWEDNSHWDPHWGMYQGWDEENDGFDEAMEEDYTGADGVAEGEEAQAVEKDAMAQQTWSQAHKSTMVARKDRGFGKAGMAQGKGKTPDGCWICGSTGHYSRQCPDRYAPGKGKSAHFHYTEEDQWAYAAAMAAAFMKGKGKGKHPGKNAAMAEDAMYFFRGKSQGKGKSMGKNYGTVNAYSMDYVGLHGLEIDEEANMDMQTSVVDHGKSLKELAATTKKSMRQPTPSGGMGMLDSGATCSAGPEGSIKRLVAAVLDRDHQAAIVVDAQKRPRFRYGSGKWGKALYQVRISSSLSSCSFYAYALPDPEESKEPWFEVTTMLVPVLVGMDFITSNGMIIDFNDG